MNRIAKYSQDSLEWGYLQGNLSSVNTEFCEEVTAASAYRPENVLYQPAVAVFTVQTQSGWG